MASEICLSLSLKSWASSSQVCFNRMNHKIFRLTNGPLSCKFILRLRPWLSWIERRTTNPKAAGSNPAGRTKKIKRLWQITHKR